jgi:GrpB-like predicted nucleotidyltransferase (UPF0157 family)
MVELQPYQHAWAEAFERESRRVAETLSGLVDAVEHIGSTAVPGLIAKPIIDMAARAVPGVDPFEFAPLVGRIGYARHATGPRTHAVYVRLSGARRTHILHVFVEAQWADCNQRLFRDRLLQDPIARDRYQGRKESLVLLDGRDYTAAKSELIQELLDEERERRGLPPATAWDKE